MATTDQLTRAWNLLRVGERPEGMEWTPGGPTAFRDNRIPEPYQNWVWNHAARDRLIVAVGGVLLGLGFWVSRPDGKYIWTRINADHEDWRNPDRLTAACDALEAERGQDD